MKKPIKLGLFFTRNYGPLAQVTTLSTIRLRDVRKWNDIATHVGVWFEFCDGIVFFEALMDKGWAGPEPMQKAADWANQDSRRRVRMYDMTVLCGFTTGDIEIGELAIF